MSRTLAAVLADRVPSRVRHRGQRYFQQGRVRILSIDVQKVEALVSGSARYKVRLVQEGGDVRSTCTCPYFDRSRTCKHIWATVLAVDARSNRIDRAERGRQEGQQGQRGPKGQRGQRGRRGPRNNQNRNEATQTQTEAQSQPQDTQPQAETAPRPAGHRGQQRRRLPRKGAPVRRPRRNIPLWMEVLETLPPDAPADLPREALLYEIDEAATRESGRLALTILEGRKRTD
ncbi:MAG TPA: SWIM zinc finger family protein, partial [Thermoanaerobaculia bacterium]|nr:SWIM zinc finger family protein [Thermoanaerobaculia bacterium]